jgi:hypothetical protein
MVLCNVTIFLGAAMGLGMMHKNRATVREAIFRKNNFIVSQRVSVF